MELTVERYGQVALVRLPGDHIDAANVIDFKEAMQVVVAESSQVVIDLSTIRFVDSAALGALLALLRDVTNVGGDLKVCRAGPQVKAILELVRLDQLIEVSETAESAVRSFDQDSLEF
jgi:anti-sigma B factor antagonist